MGDELIGVSQYNTSGVFMGTIRDIMDEANKTRVGYAMNGTNIELPQDMKRPQFGVTDPLAPSKIRVASEGPLPDFLKLTKVQSNRIDAASVRCGFKNVNDFVSQLDQQFANRFKKAYFGDAQPSKTVPMKKIALALLSTDYVQCLLQEAPNAGSFAPDAKRMLETGLAVAALVYEERLDEKDIFSYVNRRVCDAREPADMAGAAEAYLAEIRMRLESSSLKDYVLSKANSLMKAAEKEQDPRLAMAYKESAQALYRALETYQSALDVFCPRPVVPPDGKKSFESPEAQLDKQGVALESFLNSSYGKWPDKQVLCDAEDALWTALTTVASSPRGKLTGAFPDEAERPSGVADDLKTMSFIQEKLRNALAVLYGQIAASRRFARDTAVRHAQEQALARTGFSVDVPPQEGNYSVNLGGGFGLVLGLTKDNSLRVGPAYEYRMEIAVDEAGRVMLTSIHNANFSLSFGAKAGGGKAAVNFNAGHKWTDGFVFKDMKSFLEDSGALILSRLNTGLKGAFHRQWLTDSLARRADNETFSSCLREFGLLRKSDSFCTRPANRRVTDGFRKRSVFVKGGGSLRGSNSPIGKVIGNLSGNLGWDYTYQNVKVSHTKIGDMYKSLSDFPPIVRLLPNDQVAAASQRHSPAFPDLASLQNVVAQNKDLAVEGLAATLQKLEAEYADFKQAVRYERYQKRHFKFFSRKTDYMAPPVKELARHLQDRNVLDTGKTREEVCARYLSFMALSVAALRLALAEINGRDKPLASAYAGLANRLDELEESVYNPTFEIDEKHLLAHLHITQETNAARTHSVDFNVSVRGNLHLPKQIVRGTDMRSKIQPGLHVDGRYTHVAKKDRSGLPHEDADTLELTVGAAGLPLTTLGTILAGVAHKATKTNIAASSVIPLISDAVGQLPLGGLITGKGSADPFLPNVNRLDAEGKANWFLQTAGDNGIGVRLKLIKSPDGSWTIGNVQAVLYKDLQLTADVAFCAGAGIYATATAGMSSKIVISDHLRGKSLVPFMKTAAALNVGSDGSRDLTWRAYLKDHQNAVDQLAEQLSDHESESYKEFLRYIDCLSALQDPEAGFLAAKMMKALSVFATDPALLAKGASYDMRHLRKVGMDRVDELTQLLILLGKAAKMVRDAKPAAAVPEKVSEKDAMRELEKESPEHLGLLANIDALQNGGVDISLAEG